MHYDVDITDVPRRDVEATTREVTSLFIEWVRTSFIRSWISRAEKWTKHEPNHIYLALSINGCSSLSLRVLGCLDYNRYHSGTSLRSSGL